jgi:hypothetical protein
MGRILPGLVWPAVQDIDPLLARSREPALGPLRQLELLVMRARRIGKLAEF